MVFLLIFTYSLAKSMVTIYNSDKAVFRILTCYLKTLCLIRDSQQAIKTIPTILHNNITATCSIQEDLRNANFVM